MSQHATIAMTDDHELDVLSLGLTKKERMLDVLEAAAATPPKGMGVTAVVLLGESDLEFLVEWCAVKTGLSFRHQADALSPRPPRTVGARSWVRRCRRDGAVHRSVGRRSVVGFVDWCRNCCE